MSEKPPTKNDILFLELKIERMRLEIEKLMEENSNLEREIDRIKDLTEFENHEEKCRKNHA